MGGSYCGSCSAHLQAKVELKPRSYVSESLLVLVNTTDLNAGRLCQARDDSALVFSYSVKYLLTLSMRKRNSRHSHDHLRTCVMLKPVPAQADSWPRKPVFEPLRGIETLCPGRIYWT